MSDAASHLFAPPRLTVEHRERGVLVMRSDEPLGAYPPSLGVHLRAGARRHPDRVLVAERPPDRRGWRTLTWGEANERAGAVGQGLLARGCGQQRPVMVLSGNSSEHLLLTLGAHLAGVPVLPVSTAYSASPGGRTRIAAIAQLGSPGLVFADDPDTFGTAVEQLRGLVEHRLIGSAGDDGFAALTRSEPGSELETAFAAVGPETIAKVLFTSGSTGSPKGVINTHRMLCSNQRALGQIWPFLHDEPPVLVDWLPWSHTFGGNHNLNQVLAYGGTLYIDDGKPVPALFDRTIEALTDVAPTVYYNVPAGWGLLAGALERDRGFAEHFFSRLRFMFYAAAALPAELWARLRRLADEVADHEVPLTASWGTTETAPGATSAHFADAICGCIGVPLPGVTLKLVPSSGKLELRLAGPNVTPGYLHRPELTATAFDEDGFYRTGDAVTLVDPGEPARGLRFDGRLAEDFKLTSGTWVRVGALRLGLLSACAGMLSDAVICGHDREFVAALAWLSPAAADADLGPGLAAALVAHNAGAGSAGRVERLLLLSEPPSLDDGEITDKGYVNQAAVIERRGPDVARLFAEPCPAGVIETAA